MDIIQMARDLGKEIQQDARFQAFFKAAEESEKDTVLQDLIGQFNLKRMEINQEMIKQQDKDTAKLEKLEGEMKDVYGQIMANQNMINFTATKKELDDLVNFVTRIITLSATGDDPQTIEEEDASCTGSCSSCAGCH